MTYKFIYIYRSGLGVARVHKCLFSECCEVEVHAKFAKVVESGNCESRIIIIYVGD